MYNSNCLYKLQKSEITYYLFSLRLWHSALVPTDPCRDMDASLH